LLRAIIFDFDGVIVNSEPLKLKVIQQIAAKEGWSVTEAEYYRNYLPLEDHGIIEYLYRSHGQPITRARRDELLDGKKRAYAQTIGEGLPALPGAVDFVRRAAARHTLAIASGSLRSEIEHLLRKLELREAFAVLATADDSERSKPHPEVYLQALIRLQQLPGFRQKPLSAADCLAIEDAPHGVLAAQKAGIRCLALSHSVPPEELRHADWVFRGFAEVDLARLQAAFA
jgi:HAD superfamily hydrolase (TIGR01509 family)